MFDDISPLNMHHSLLLSASNDGSVSLWDLSTATATSTATSSHSSSVHAGFAALPPTFHSPSCISSLPSLHRQGVFSCHECQLAVAAGSRDRSVTVSRITPSGLILEHRRQHDREAAVRSVRWR